MAPLLYLQLVMKAAAGPSQEEEARQASVQEVQNLKESLGQAEARAREVEGQLEGLNKVRLFVHYYVDQTCLKT